MPGDFSRTFLLPFVFFWDVAYCNCTSYQVALAVIHFNPRCTQCSVGWEWEARRFDLPIGRDEVCFLLFHTSSREKESETKGALSFLYKSKTKGSIH